MSSEIKSCIFYREGVLRWQKLRKRHSSRHLEMLADCWICKRGHVGFPSASRKKSPAMSNGSRIPLWLVFVLLIMPVICKQRNLPSKVKNNNAIVWAKYPQNLPNEYTMKLHLYYRTSAASTRIDIPKKQWPLLYSLSLPSSREQGQM